MGAEHSRSELLKINKLSSGCGVGETGVTQTLQCPAQPFVAEYKPKFVFRRELKIWEEAVNPVFAMYTFGVCREMRVRVPRIAAMNWLSSRTLSRWEKSMDFLCF